MEDRKQKALAEAEAKDKAHKEWLQTPEGIAETKRLKEKLDYNSKQNIEKRKRRMRADRKARARGYANNVTKKFKYADRVVVANPLRKEEGCGDTYKHKGLRGRIRGIGGCKCVHARKNGCYYVTLTSTGKRHHFEECELEKVND
jgi:hypothetical protein